MRLVVEFDDERLWKMETRLNMGITGRFLWDSFVRCFINAKVTF